MRDIGVHPDIAGFQDLAHAFDLKSAALAARATLEAALERRETRGCHNRSDYPELDASLQVNLVWSGPGRIEREAIPPIPDEIAALMQRGLHRRQARRASFAWGPARRPTKTSRAGGQQVSPERLRRRRAERRERDRAHLNAMNARGPDASIGAAQR